MKEIRTPAIRKRDTFFQRGTLRSQAVAIHVNKLSIGDGLGHCHTHIMPLRRQSTCEPSDVVRTVIVGLAVVDEKEVHRREWA